MPILYPHTLSDGQCINIEIKRSAKKNLILRPINSTRLSINIPPFLADKHFQKWLSANEALLHQTLAKKAQHTASPKTPEWIWLLGKQIPLHIHNNTDIDITPSKIFLPDINWQKQKQLLRNTFTQLANTHLLPRLAEHAHAMQLHPNSIQLSNAKTFWGVCRTHTGIRLNWRLIGAPDFVIDYVCIHELCHLPHPNHSSRFWSMVNQHTLHTNAAKSWLKTHGAELFLLDVK